MGGVRLRIHLFAGVGVEYDDRARGAGAGCPQDLLGLALAHHLGDRPDPEDAWSGGLAVAVGQAVDFELGNLLGPAEGIGAAAKSQGCQHGINRRKSAGYGMSLVS